MKMRRSWSPLPFLLAAVLAVVACAPMFGSASAPAQPAAPYRILVANDDGVRAPGILAVAQALKALGEVTVVAPAENQSGKGHSITIYEPIFREDMTLAGGLRAIGLTATPASTMKVALTKIVTPKPDLVVSGINRGYNLGLSSYLSGTVGAAREAASRGIPAIAASLGMPATDYSTAAAEIARIAEHVKTNGLPAGVFLNVNVPHGPLKGVMLTTQGMTAGGKEDFAERKHPNGRTYYWNVFEEGGTDASGTDVWAVEGRFVSITPLKVPEYDAAAAAKLKTLATASR
jgi:5'-nucleotidase